MSRSRELVDPFLRDVLELEVSGPTLDDLVTLSEPGADSHGAPSDAALKARLLERARHAGRFDRFSVEVAELLDLPVETARSLLDRMADPDVWSNDIPVGRAYWLPGGPRVRDYVRGFVHIAAGATFPEHDHLGEETKLVLQGSFVDDGTGKRYRVGETCVLPGGSSHSISVPADGVDLLALVVTHRGYRVGETLLAPR